MIVNFGPSIKMLAFWFGNSWAKHLKWFQSDVALSFLIDSPAPSSTILLGGRTWFLLAFSPHQTHGALLVFQCNTDLNTGKLIADIVQSFHARWSYTCHASLYNTNVGTKRWNHLVYCSINWRIIIPCNVILSCLYSSYLFCSYFCLYICLLFFLAFSLFPWGFAFFFYDVESNYFVLIQLLLFCYDFIF